MKMIKQFLDDDIQRANIFDKVPAQGEVKPPKIPQKKKIKSKERSAKKVNERLSHTNQTSSIKDNRKSVESCKFPSVTMSQSNIQNSFEEGSASARFLPSKSMLRAKDKQWLLNRIKDVNQTISSTTRPPKNPRTDEVR